MYIYNAIFYVNTYFYSFICVTVGMEVRRQL